MTSKHGHIMCHNMQFATTLATIQHPFISYTFTTVTLFLSTHPKTTMSSQTRLASGQPLPFDTMTLFCWVFGDGNPFPVDISPEKTVGHLKEAIVAKDPDRFQGIGAYKLKLYKKIIPSEEKENLQLSELEKEALLNETWEISEYFETDPPKKYIHIVIKTPGKWDSDFVF